MRETSSALIDQLVYIDNFLNSGEETPNLDMDGQLLLDLAAFADDSFVFPDEEKPNWDDSKPINIKDVDVSGLPKFPVPPGAKSSLEKAGLSQNQIDLLSALIAQHQSQPRAGASRDLEDPALATQSPGTPSSDKRRRNTEASARFRIKKKMKEREMEVRIEQLDSMVHKCEQKINELEMENRLLKNLIIEKGNRNLEEELRALKERAGR